MVSGVKCCVILALVFVAISFLYLMGVISLTYGGEQELDKTFGKIYSTVIGSGSKMNNQVWSPFGLKLMLAMFYCVVENQNTTLELRKVLEWTGKRDEDMIRDLKNKIDKVSTGVLPFVNISFVTGGFMDEQLGKNLETHENLIWGKCAGNIQLINLADASVAATSLNTWTKRETAGRIENLLSASEYLEWRKEPKKIKMVVTNVIYFEAKWNTSFILISPKTGSRFYTDSSKKHHVPTHFWSTKGHFYHANIRRLNAGAVTIPLQGGKFSITAILPHEWSDITSLEKKIAEGYPLTSLALKLGRKQMGGIGRDLEESKENQNTSQMGFGNVGALFQKTVLRVRMKPKRYPIMHRRTTTRMRFDRPFIAYILEESTNTIVMMFRKVN